MYTPVHWITSVPGVRLGTMARPRGGDWLDDELQHLTRAGVHRLACALTHAELRELDLTREPQRARRAGLRFHHVPIADRGVPDHMQAFDAQVTELLCALRAGQSVVAHCRQGIGRASLIAAALLMRLGVDEAQAWRSIQEARGRPVPDEPYQRQWLAQRYVAWVRGRPSAVAEDQKRPLKEEPDASRRRTNT